VRLCAGTGIGWPLERRRDLAIRWEAGFGDSLFDWKIIVLDKGLVVVGM
jgi:hypothetical protein